MFLPVGKRCPSLKWRRAGESNPLPEGSAVHKTAPVTRQMPSKEGHHGSNRVRPRMLRFGPSCYGFAHGDAVMRSAKSLSSYSPVQQKPIAFTICTPQRSIVRFPQRITLDLYGNQIRMESFSPKFESHSQGQKVRTEKSALARVLFFLFACSILSCKRLLSTVDNSDNCGNCTENVAVVGN